MKDWASSGCVEPVPRGHTTVQALREARALAAVFATVHKRQEEHLTLVHSQSPVDPCKCLYFSRVLLRAWCPVGPPPPPQPFSLAFLLVFPDDGLIFYFTEKIKAFRHYFPIMEMPSFPSFLFRGRNSPFFLRLFALT